MWITFSSGIAYNKYNYIIYIGLRYMLVHLSIKNYAIVDHLDLELMSGMSVITGETGAGKSIMLDALGLSLGDRCDSSVVRQGADKADILATFELADIPEAKQWLIDHDLANEEVCILRRVINQDGRSRGYINGTPCPLSHLKELGEWLIDIHSQHEHQSLLKTDTHRALLDNYAGNTLLVEEVRLVAQQWRQTEQKLKQLSGDSEEQQAKQQLLSYQLDELEKLALSDNEVEQLEEEQRNLSQADTILSACQQVLDACSNDDTNIISTLSMSIRRLMSFKEPVEGLSEAISLFNNAQIQLEEAIDEVHHFVDHFEADPSRQQQVEERLDTIYSLARKHHVQPIELIALTTKLQQELASIHADDEQLVILADELALLVGKYQQLATKLSAERKKAAEKLAKAVQKEMQTLGMPGGQFTISLKPLISLDPTPHGLESIEFLVSANPGQPLRALNKVASGGELSRISLAIQVITAQTSRVPTLVFDEVDVGIGGPTAEIVGKLLRTLGEKGQVLTVTHLPQVAAQGHQHLFVHKERHKNSTQTAVSLLTKQQRIEEVARMLGGVDLTKESLAHAEKLLVNS